MSKTAQFNPPDGFSSGEKVDSRGDSRSGNVYVFNERIRLSVQVALATGRPLLVRGDSGWGKSSLAAASAKYLEWDFHEAVITSRTQARDLQWHVDLLKRLNDAQAGILDPDWRRYLYPGALWWAFDPQGASAQQAVYEKTAAADVSPATVKRAVVLLDEIDKADPDVPNNLLVTLGSLEFRVDETGQLIKADKSNGPLVFITTNDERELPTAFLRRCIELRLPALEDEDSNGAQRRALLMDIVLKHGILQSGAPLNKTWLQKVTKLLMPEPKEGQEPLIPSPAEFKDTIIALIDRYGAADPPKGQLDQIAEMTFTKRKYWRS